MEETALNQPAETEPEVERSEAQKKLTADELTVVKALLAGKTVRAAGKTVGKCKRTVQYWIRKPAMREALREGRDALLKEASTLLHSQTTWAIRTLRDLALDKEVGGFARVSAARAIVELAYKTAVADDQSDQMAEIRELLAASRRAVTEGEGVGMGCRR